ncbi:MAG: dipicolinate synthase subunit B [Agathobacter sp.]|nr:dipicolinate synthase subunit B [Agathobacter sp.]
MNFSKLTIGYGITGSFCTFSKSKKAVENLVALGTKVIPIFSYHVQEMDTRFGNAKEYIEEICTITNSKGIYSIQEAEPIGPKNLLDVMVIAPCTGNTAAKLWNGIVDTPVLMAAKAHMRNGNPLVLAISTNDALGNCFKNIGNLMNMKQIYFVPFGQDDYVKKPNSMVADLEQLPETIRMALDGKQIQPVISRQ